MVRRVSSLTEPDRESVLELFAGLCSGSEDVRPLPPGTMIVAHPDDETVGAGAALPWLLGSMFLYVTDGAPRNMHDALAAGYPTREHYAAARRIERRSALSLAGIEEGQVKDLEFPDQEASLNLVPMVRRIADFLDAQRHSFVLTHPYEGGHPDHDAAAFAVHAACELLNRSGTAMPLILEMTSYHNCNGQMATAEFLPNPGGPIAVLRLNDTQRRLKQQLMDSYVTQRRTLACFSTERECYRLAPRYDFTLPPHEGPLFYERFPWGMTGERFRRLAAEALGQLGLDRS